MSRITSAVFILMFFSGYRLAFCANNSISGDWQTTIYFAAINTELNTSFTLIQKDNNYTGHSTTNSSNRILGFFKGTMVKMFAKKTFEHGSLLHLRQGKVSGDSISAILYSLFGPRLKFQGKMITNSSIQGFLFDGADKIWGGFIMTKGDLPITINYNNLAKQLILLTKSRIYHPEVTRHPVFKRFEKKLNSIASVCKDDLDFFASFFYLTRQKYNLPFTHYSLFRRPLKILRENAVIPIPAKAQVPENVTLDLTNDSIAVLKILTFSTHPVSQIDSCFHILKSRRIPNLIIDLTKNTGGTISSMRIAEHLVREPSAAGYFLTNKWFTTYSQPPDSKAYDALSELDESNLNKLWDGIHNFPGFKLKVNPQDNPYTGRVFLLTSRYTASACEPLCYNLKFYKRAILVGQKTAGEMLNGEKFDFDTWTLNLPSADYYTVDHKRIDQIGIEPHVTTKIGEELMVAKSLIKKP